MKGDSCAIVTKSYRDNLLHWLLTKFCSLIEQAIFRADRCLSGFDRSFYKYLEYRSDLPVGEASRNENRTDL